MTNEESFLAWCKKQNIIPKRINTESEKSRDYSIEDDVKIYFGNQLMPINPHQRPHIGVFYFRLDGSCYGGSSIVWNTKEYKEIVGAK